MRLVVLSSKTGGGHEMRAQAIQEVCDELEIGCTILRPLETGSPIYLFGTHIYNWIQRFYPRVHTLYFKWLEFASLHNHSKKIIGSHDFLRKMRGLSPNLVISVHAHLNHGFLELSKSINRPTPPKFAIYCGELADGIGFSKHWINSDADLFCGPTKKTIEAAIKRGMPTKKCKVWGALLRSPFYQSVNSSQVHSFCLKYDIDPKLPIGVLATGANGVNSHMKVLQGFADKDLGIQIIALCGQSAVLFNQLKGFGERSKIKIIPVMSINSNEMKTLLEMSDWVFGRPGAGLTSEVISIGKSMYFDTSRGIMPQEQNNLNFWRSCGANPVLISNARQLANNITHVNRNKFPKLLLDRTLIVNEIKKLLPY
jgi:processive 1,2-diacylglycerol beta-glucosyltransferase